MPGLIAILLVLCLAFLVLVALKQHAREEREADDRLRLRRAKPSLLYRCRKCGALWRHWLDDLTWSLKDGEQRPGQCCNNSPEFRDNLEVYIPKGDSQ